MRIGYTEQRERWESKVTPCNINIWSHIFARYSIQSVLRLVPIIFRPASSNPALAAESQLCHLVPMGYLRQRDNLPRWNRQQQLWSSSICAISIWNKHDIWIYLEQTKIRKGGTRNIKKLERPTNVFKQVMFKLFHPWSGSRWINLLIKTAPPLSYSKGSRAKGSRQRRKFQLAPEWRRVGGTHHNWLGYIVQQFRSPQNKHIPCYLDPQFESWFTP